MSTLREAAQQALEAFVCDAAIAQKGSREIKEALGLTQWYPVKTSWSGHVVMVDAESYEEAIDIHMRSRKEGKP
jgi:hypothetical protein